MIATADLGMVAAWASYGAERHNDARRLWMIALSAARQADHPRVTDLTADLLLDMAHQALQRGHAYYTLALATADVKHAAQAVPLLREAVDGYGPAYARSRAVNLAGLAGAQALTGDLDTVARTGHHAVEEITALASPRAYDRLHTLDTVLRPYATDPAVDEVRGEIHTALAVA